MAERKNRRWATLKKAAEYLGEDTSPEIIRGAIARGEVTGYRFGPKAIRVDLNEIDAAMKPIRTAVGRG